MRKHPTAASAVASVAMLTLTLTLMLMLMLTLTLTPTLTARGNSPQTDTWPIITPDRAVALPADHVSHPDYKIEWWYYTGNLDTREGRRFGYQVTFFRVGVNRTVIVAAVRANFFPSEWSGSRSHRTRDLSGVSPARSSASLSRTPTPP